MTGTSIPFYILCILHGCKTFIFPRNWISRSLRAKARRRASKVMRKKKYMKKVQIKYICRMVIIRLWQQWRNYFCAPLNISIRKCVVSMEVYFYALKPWKYIKENRPPYQRHLLNPQKSIMCCLVDRTLDWPKVQAGHYGEIKNTFSCQ